MIFDLNDDQLTYVNLAQQISTNVLAPHAAKWDAQSIFPKATLRQAGELGFCGLYSDPEIGGLGLSRLDSSLIFEQPASSFQMAQPALRRLARRVVVIFLSLWVEGLKYLIIKPLNGSTS